MEFDHLQRTKAIYRPATSSSSPHTRCAHNGEANFHTWLSKLSDNKEAISTWDPTQMYIRVWRRHLLRGDFRGFGQWVLSESYLVAGGVLWIICACVWRDAFGWIPMGWEAVLVALGITRVLWHWNAILQAVKLHSWYDDVMCSNIVKRCHKVCALNLSEKLAY
jgi:hypothetical protein